MQNADATHSRRLNASNLIVNNSSLHHYTCNVPRSQRILLSVSGTSILLHMFPLALTQLQTADLAHLAQPVTVHSEKLAVGLMCTIR